MIKRKYVRTRSLQSGMKIDQAIIDRMGRTLIARGAILDDYMIEALMNRGVSGVYTVEGEEDGTIEKENISEKMIEKIEELKEIIDAEGLDVDIEVDGGINDETMETVLKAGANLLVAGSYVFNGDLVSNVRHAKERMNDIIREID